jgi:hypothetical protein
MLRNRSDVCLVTHGSGASARSNKNMQAVCQQSGQHWLFPRHAQLQTPCSRVELHVLRSGEAVAIIVDNRPLFLIVLPKLSDCFGRCEEGVS